MSTVGYGDLSPQTKLGKALALVYLPLAVFALADAVADASMIRTRRKIRETSHAHRAHELLLAERKVEEVAPVSSRAMLSTMASTWARRSDGRRGARELASLLFAAGATLGVVTLTIVGARSASATNSPKRA